MIIIDIEDLNYLGEGRYEAPLSAVGLDSFPINFEVPTLGAFLRLISADGREGWHYRKSGSLVSVELYREQ